MRLLHWARGDLRWWEFFYCPLETKLVYPVSKSIKIPFPIPVATAARTGRVLVWMRAVPARRCLCPLAAPLTVLAEVADFVGHRMLQGTWTRRLTSIFHFPSSR